MWNLLLLFQISTRLLQLEKRSLFNFFFCIFHFEVLNLESLELLLCFGNISILTQKRTFYDLPFFVYSIVGIKIKKIKKNQNVFNTQTALQAITRERKIVRSFLRLSRAKNSVFQKQRTDKILGFNFLLIYCSFLCHVFQL